MVWSRLAANVLLRFKDIGSPELDREPTLFQYSFSPFYCRARVMMDSTCGVELLWTHGGRA